MAIRRQVALTWNTVDQDREFLAAMASDVAGDEKLRKRAAVILSMLNGSTVRDAATSAGVGEDTARKTVEKYNGEGWRGLLTVQSPRGGDFLARYDQGYWAERLTRVCLDQSRFFRAIPYGTSRSEPFHDLQSFREYSINEFLLQAWSADGRWKRPDLLSIPRNLLQVERGNDQWTPDLKLFDNNQCQPYIQRAAAAIEIETSLWQVQRATVRLSFTVKEEDLASLRSWVQRCNVPLYVVQVFYDQAYVLPFATLEEVIALPDDDARHVAAEVDRFTNKNTYKIPLLEGKLLGNISEPDVEGRVFKAPDGRVTVYGRLTGSAIDVADQQLLEQLMTGTL